MSARNSSSHLRRIAKENAKKSVQKMPMKKVFYKKVFL